MGRLLIHPGEHLADELEALGMSANQLAKELGVPANRITQIIQGKRGITGDTALRLGRWFGTGPEIWINLQENYELRLAEAENGEAFKEVPQRLTPAKELLEDFWRLENEAEELHAIRTSIEAQITTLLAYRKSLIHECVTGQRRVTEADVARVQREKLTGAALP